jgi:hypothetical protein
MSKFLDDDDDAGAAPSDTPQMHRDAAPMLATRLYVPWLPFVAWNVRRRSARACVCV